ncbi:carbamoyl phosphate synthase large subunit [Salicibibacter halophilus]|uniref:Carbamoyl phosphate synthase large chain n=1 Tax=Salicibibacter halophilus TaxID=2502791 RepID=A0A514LGG8_9BACI|nr:carbamoyl phosphate synthase large subunit [Salicibibacter halophilus]QDI90943.1 carbamoyl phosphate synthase large subunit [Salicibibacter halophilus]
MPKKTRLRKILVLGSGPIVIGQAAEFDYAGTQACLALREEGCEVVLINNNPATVMTDDTCADKVYFEPLTLETLTRVLEEEQPDGLLATMGGQTGLNLALSAYESGLLEQSGVELLGTPMASIQQGEDREAFRGLMQELNEPVPESTIVTSAKEAIDFAETVGYPTIVRPAYTLGGGGGGIANNQTELATIVSGGLDASPIDQCLVEKSIAGFKEIEYEVMRDANDTCISVCNMENIDPVGIHTGDSIVVAPSQTLSDHDYQMLRTASVKVIRALGIVGGCNIQFALDPYSDQYYLIEVNPRVSRSSALASKATGYPIARLAAKVGLGYGLHELKNPVTAHTYASFEPALDYVIVKFPRWPFDKFMDADRTLGTQMKATGEVMAIERNMQAAIQKAVRSLEIKLDGLRWPGVDKLPNAELETALTHADDRRFFYLLELMRRGYSSEKLAAFTAIDRFFLDHFQRLITAETKAEATAFAEIDDDMLKTWKKEGFSDRWLAACWGMEERALRQYRFQQGIIPSYHIVDTCAGEFEAETPYYYSTYQGMDEAADSGDKPKILIVGSGPIRIGQGIEFDYCSVNGANAVKTLGYEAIMMNNNPETVSTDYETADKLYFEPLTAEDVIHVAERENVEGVLLQLGGQTSIALTEALEAAGLQLFGAPFDVIDQLEDRGRFYELMQKTDIAHIPGQTGADADDTIRKAREIGYPVLLRPSYVIGGQGMSIFTSEKQLTEYVETHEEAIAYPILIDAYFAGKELEVDVVTDGDHVFIPGVFEHIEKAGVHSGDSIAITPPYELSDAHQQQIVTYAKTIARELDFVGLFNIQFVLSDNTLYVIEINPRASRTVPIFAKASGNNLVEQAVKLLLGKDWPEVFGQRQGLATATSYFAVKAPVFSTEKLPGLDPLLGAEMKSTGELLSFGETKEEAMTQAFAWKDDKTPAIYQQNGSIYCHIATDQKAACEPALEALKEAGFTIYDPATYSFKRWLEDDDGLLYINIPPTGSRENKEERLAAEGQRKMIVTGPETLRELVAAREIPHRVCAVETWKQRDLQRT